MYVPAYQIYCVMQINNTTGEPECCTLTVGQSEADAIQNAGGYDPNVRLEVKELGRRVVMSPNDQVE